jgi:hypothetical protein
LLKEIAMKITLDTNCFFEYFERDPALISEIIIFQEQGFIEIAMTTRVMSDTLDKWKGQSISPTWERIQGFPLVEVVGTVFRLDMTHLNSEDYLVTDEQEDLLNNLHAIISEAQIEDLDHLFGHIIAERDIFVTNDHHFLDHQEQLKQEFNVVVLNPKDAVQLMRNSFSDNANR